MRIVVGSGCTGHGRCYTLVPRLFEDDDQGYGVARGTGALAEDDIGDASRAIDACPEGAIAIEGRDT
jgi:ferredoxin